MTIIFQKFTESRRRGLEPAIAHEDDVITLPDRIHQLLQQVFTADHDFAPSIQWPKRLLRVPINTPSSH